MSSTIERLLNRVVGGQRLLPHEGLILLESNDLAAIARAADEVTRCKHPEDYRTYNIDRNVNYTNICVSGCRFCAFHCKPGAGDGYVIERDELYGKIEETIELGGDQILMQGGMHPDLTIAWYESLVRAIRERFPQVNVHGFSPTEIEHVAQVSELSTLEVLRRLKAAGLGACLGAVPRFLWIECGTS